MPPIPQEIAEFLACKRIAVAGVSRTGGSAGNGILRKLRAQGYDAIPVNPHAVQLGGTACYRDLASIPGDVDGVVIAVAPEAGAELVRAAAARGIRRVWLHRSIGQGSVSGDAVAECRRLDLTCIVGGCPLMYCEPVDIVHRCMRAVLAWRGRLVEVSSPVRT
ncbi:MAG TPA: CoA-binding protein [Vicinamibacterales bacterium]|nr:CoA-binding protein [Vicinamibacterales bacterium]